MTTRAQLWLEGPFDEETKKEIRRLSKEDPSSLNDAFYKMLSFGTGGMRGIMGVGTNRMNVYTIRMATQGLANYLKQQPQKPTRVFIGYDVRHNSRLFAEETAKVLAGNGIEPLLAQQICPTPLVSFACRHFSCSAAIMITASHNPPEYNGYKVYWAGGGQVVYPHDQGIIEEVEKITSPAQVLMGSHYTEIGEEITVAYLAELKKLQMLPELSKVDLKIIYTNLHGTGLHLMPKALHTWGYDIVFFVEKQKQPDPDFSFAPSPNPETAQALELGMEQLQATGGDLLLATDPDADRIAAAVRGGRLSGNQMACLMAYHICSTLSEKGELPPNAAFVKTIVTTELFKAIVEDFGAKCIDVLTGFKYIAEQIHIWETSFGAYQFLFGAEESYGYLFGTYVRDKDGISAGCLIAEIAASLKRQGKTLFDLLDLLYQKYGIYREASASISFPEGQAGMEKIARCMEQLRADPPKRLGKKKIVLIEDYFHGLGSLPPSDVLRFWLTDKSKLVIRPSGTEPKIKVYAEVAGQRSISEADTYLQSLIQDFQRRINYG